MPLIILCIYTYSLFIIATHSMALFGIGIYPEWYMSDKYAHLLVVIYYTCIFYGFLKKKPMAIIALAQQPIVHGIVFYLDRGNTDWFLTPWSFIYILIWYVGCYVYFNLPAVKQYFKP